MSFIDDENGPVLIAEACVAAAGDGGFVVDDDGSLLPVASAAWSSSTASSSFATSSTQGGHPYAISGDDVLPLATALVLSDDDGDRHHHPFSGEDGGPADARAIVADDEGRHDPFLFDLIKDSSRGPERWADVLLHWRSRPSRARYVSRPPSHRTPLHEACRSDAPPAVVTALLEAYPDAAWARDGSSNTPLHLVFATAAQSSSSMAVAEPLNDEGRAEVVKILLRVGGDDLAMALNEHGSTPLHVACANHDNARRSTSHNASIWELLGTSVAAAASVVDKEGKSPLARFCDACWGETSSDAATLRLLLNKHPEAACTADRAGGSVPLHAPALRGDAAAVRILLEVDEAGVAAGVENNDGETALHWACRGAARRGFNRGDDVGGGGGALTVVRLLLEKHPNAALVREKSFGRVALHVACGGVGGRRTRIGGGRRGDGGGDPLMDIVRSLIKFEPSAAAVSDYNGYLPIHCACELGDLAPTEVVAMLLAAYPEGALSMTKKLDTPLHLAAEHNSPYETVKLLIEACPEAIGRLNDYGFSPLHCICRSYEPTVESVNLLVSQRPECLFTSSNGGERPLHLACYNGHVPIDVVRVLLAAQRNATESLSSSKRTETACDSRDMTNKVGNTPLHESVFRHAPYILISTLATSNPEWSRIPNNAGYSPLHLACKGGTTDVEVIQMLLKLAGDDAALNVDRAGHTPLHSAVHGGSDSAVVAALLDVCPAALAAATDHGDTALHLAVLRSAPLGTVRLLAERSDAATLLRRNLDGLSCLDILMEQFQSGRSTLKAEDFDNLCTVCIVLVRHVSHVTSDEIAGSAGDSRAPLLHAALSIGQRQDHSLIDTDFLRFIMYNNAEQVREKDGSESLPLHLEAALPLAGNDVAVESSGTRKDRSAGPVVRSACYGNAISDRVQVLNELVEINPGAARERNGYGKFPLGIMIGNGRRWRDGVQATLMAYPPALLWEEHILDDRLFPQILFRVGQECSFDTIYQLFRSKPDIAKLECNM